MQTPATLRYAAFGEVSILRRVRWLATVVPVVGLILLGLFRHFVIDHWLPGQSGWIAETAILVVLALIFSTFVVGVFDRLQRDLSKLYADASAGRDRLQAVQEAGLALASDLALDRLLQRVVDLSRQIIQARYAALGVFGEDGQTQRFIYSRPDQGPAAQQPLPLDRNDGSFLSVPVTYQGKAIGHLYIADKESGIAFAEADREMAELFAAHAAVALTNARLYQQVQRLAVVEERQRIGMDLHDGTIQQLYAIGLMLESVIGMLGEQSNASARDRLDRVADQLNQTIDNIRHYIFDLRSETPGLALPEALMQIATQIGVQPITRVDMQTDAWRRLSRDQTAALWHIAREVFSNAARHAHPHKILVTVSNEPGGSVQIQFRDDGEGFDALQEFDETHHGLRNMRIRARQQHGDLQVLSARGKGTTVQVRFKPEENPVVEEDAE